MIWDLADMIAQGYVVVATDYPGLGVPRHPPLSDRRERGTRRARFGPRGARAAEYSGASNRFAVWGHSQGGHAALYTGEVAARYAPELKLVGVAAAAPATYLVELFDADESTASKELSPWRLYVVEAREHAGREPCRARSHAAFERTAQDCIESVAEFEAIEKAEKPLERTSS